MSRNQSAPEAPIELADVATLLWSFVQLGDAAAAMETLHSIPAEMAEQCSTADMHTLTLCLWSLLVLRAYDHLLLPPVLLAISTAQAGIKKPPQLCRLAECMLMIQLEAPQGLNIQLPPELRMRSEYAWQQTYTAVQQAEAAPSQLVEISAALDGLGLPHRVRVFNTYPIDVLISHEATNGSATFAILLHPPSHYTSLRNLLGSLQLKARLLQALGCVVLHIRHDEWNEQRTDDARQRALREMLNAHLGPLKQALAAPPPPPPVESKPPPAAPVKNEAVAVDPTLVAQAQQRSQSTVAAAMAAFREQQAQQAAAQAGAGGGAAGNGHAPMAGE